MLEVAIAFLIYIYYANNYGSIDELPKIEIGKSYRFCCHLCLNNLEKKPIEPEIQNVYRNQGWNSSL